MTTETLRNAQAAGLRRRRSSRQSRQSTVFLPRLVERDLPFHQSRNRVSVKNENQYSRIWWLLVMDWFHVLLRIPVWISVTALLVVWTVIIVLFALVYVKIDEAWLQEDCGLGEPGVPIQFGTSFAFSLETATTVGYGLPGSNNGFFANACPGVQAAIYAQMTWSMMFNAFLFAFFFTILSKCENRSVQVVFADKLCINVKDSQMPLSDKVDDESSNIFINARCYDIDSAYPIVEAHVRMYLIDRHMKMHILRLHEPNDDLGGVLYTSLPVEISHRIDHHSPLSPIKFRKLPFLASTCGLALRSVDSTTGNRDEIVCPVCGESYGTYERLRKHVAYSRIIEESDEYPRENSHLGLDVPDKIPTLTMDEVRDFISESLSEIIVVVEGIDPQVSGTFQALQSYKYDDIAWEGIFEPCLSVQNDKFVVNMERFHQVRCPEEYSSSEDSDGDSLIQYSA